MIKLEICTWQWVPFTVSNLLLEGVLFTGDTSYIFLNMVMLRGVLPGLLQESAWQYQNHKIIIALSFFTCMV